MLRWFIPAAAATLWAAAAAADCPVLLEGKRAPITARTFPSWAAVHQALKGSPAASEGAAKRALCPEAAPCGDRGAVHVLDRDTLTVLTVGLDDQSPPKPAYRLYEGLAGALGAYGEDYTVQVVPLDSAGGWHHLKAKHEIIGHEQMCDDGECPAARVVQGYEFVDVVFQGARFAFGAPCQTDEGDDDTPAALARAGERFRYARCGQGQPTQVFTLPTPTTCQPVAGPLTDWKVALREGRAAAAAQDWAGALGWFDRLVALDPARADWRGERGYLFLKADRLAEAEADLRAALAGAMADPVRGMILYNLGLTLEAAGRPQEAFNVFLRSDDVRPHKATKARIKALKKALKKAPRKSPKTAGSKAPAE